jgi:hypothetical protein
MRDIVAGHRGHGEDGERAAVLEIGGLLVAPRELRVKIAHIAAIGGDGLHRDADLLHGIGIRGHVAQQDEDALAFLDRKFFRDRKGHVRNQQPLDDGVRGEVDEHHGAREDACILEATQEIVIVVEDETEPAEHDDVGIGLDADTGQKGVVGLAGHREDRNLLAFHERVEDIDHGHVGAHHLGGEQPPSRVCRGTVDLDLGVFGKPRTRIEGRAVAAKDPPEDVRRIGHPHRMTQKAHGCLGRETLGPRKDLKRNQLALDPDHTRHRLEAAGILDHRQITEGNALRLIRYGRRNQDLEQIADDLDDLGITGERMGHLTCFPG